MAWSKAERVALVIAVLASGCEGVLSTGVPGDGGGVRLVDAGRGPDGGRPSGDAGMGVDGGGAPIDAGRMTDAGMADPCGAPCGANARCDAASRMCVCLPGFISMGGACTPIAPGDPQGRTETEVCDQWRMGQVENSARPWPMPSDMCDPGALDPVAIEDTLRRVTMYRWLVGLGPVSEDASQRDRDQACALMMYRNRMLNHMPPSSWACYSDAGRMGASTSNLALGISSPGDAIDLYVDDSRVPSLGHRRWVFNGPLGRVGIGFAGNAQCLGVFDRSATSMREWTSWPNPGPSPIDAAPGQWWSFHHQRASLTSATMTIVRAGDGMTMTGAVSYPPNGYGPNTVAFEPSGWRPAVGETYRVTVDGFSGGPVMYETTFVACR